MSDEVPMCSACGIRPMEYPHDDDRRCGPCYDARREARGYEAKYGENRAARCLRHGCRLAFNHQGPCRVGIVPGWCNPISLTTYTTTDSTKNYWNIGSDDVLLERIAKCESAHEETRRELERCREFSHRAEEHIAMLVAKSGVYEEKIRVIEARQGDDSIASVLLHDEAVARIARLEAFAKAIAPKEVPVAPTCSRCPALATYHTHYAGSLCKECAKKYGKQVPWDNPAAGRIARVRAWVNTMPGAMVAVFMALCMIGALAMQTALYLPRLVVAFR